MQTCGTSLQLPHPKIEFRAKRQIQKQKRALKAASGKVVSDPSEAAGSVSSSVCEPESHSAGFLQQTGEFPWRARVR
jgi:hypothetical protein